MSNALKFRTTINGVQQKATDNFGTVYTLTKDGHAHNWHATVTTPGFGSIGPRTDELVRGVSFARARQAANEAHNKSGGR